MHAFKHIGLYALLVGLPGLGLLAILRVGAGIEPPPPLAGAWVLHAEHGGACLPGDMLAIEQSGRYLRVRPRAVEAEVDRDGMLRARWAIETGPCAGRSADWRAEMGGGRLEGPLAVEDCGLCPSRLEARRAE